MAIHEQNSNFNEFIISQEIAIGESMNKIYKGTWHSKPAVMKYLGKDSISMTQREFFGEVFIMSLLNHKRVVSSMAASTKPPHLFVVTKYYANGSIAQLLENPNVNLEYHQILKMLIDAAKGLIFLSI